jgi:uncharacterized membrane protein YvbJ
MTKKCKKMFFFQLLNSRKMKLFLVSLLIACVFILNLFMLNKVVSNSEHTKKIERTIKVNRQ